MSYENSGRDTFANFRESRFGIAILNNTTERSFYLTTNTSELAKTKVAQAPMINESDVAGKGTMCKDCSDVLTDEIELSCSGYQRVFIVF